MKYIARKVIKGKAYYYLQYKKYSKNLGPYLPLDLPQQLIDFFQTIGEKEAQKIPADIKEKFKYGRIETLEKLHYFYIVLKHDLSKKLHDHFYKRLALLFTYHSNRSEGSKTTKKQILDFSHSRIRKPKTKTQREIFNSFMAFNHITSSEMKWNMKSVKHLHTLLLDDLDPMIAGQWKKENNIVGNHLTVDHRQVPSAMKDLMSWLSNELKKKTIYPPELALRFYTRFEFIHPFADGNGRVGRLLLNAILYKFNYPPVIFFSENHQEHCAAIEQAQEGRYKKLHKHFLKQVKKTNAELYKLK